jgi:malate dehydrogenase (oxaloacetate-decarboxylating)
VIFPLSNPTSACEAAPSDLVRWSEGRAIIATGSPFRPVRSTNGVTHNIGQGNNALVFPGLGFGSILANATEVTDNMVMAASMALADFTERRHLSAGLVYPPISELREVSIAVATRVIAQAFEDGVATTTKLSPATAEAYVRSHFWRPRYLPFVRG